MDYSFHFTLQELVAEVDTLMDWLATFGAVHLTDLAIVIKYTIVPVAHRNRYRWYWGYCG